MSFSGLTFFGTDLTCLNTMITQFPIDNYIPVVIMQIPLVFNPSGFWNRGRNRRMPPGSEICDNRMIVKYYI
jgi:hypothetical protein